MPWWRWLVVRATRMGDAGRKQPPPSPGSDGAGGQQPSSLRQASRAGPASLPLYWVYVGAAAAAASRGGVDGDESRQGLFVNALASSAPLAHGTAA